MKYGDILSNQIRVKTSKAGGSGTVIYSQERLGGFHSYAITCHHVIDDAITVRDEWDPRVGRQRKKEYRQLVTTEFFDWAASPHGHRPLTSSIDAEVVAYDKNHDMALLKLRMVKAAQAVAELYPPAAIEELQVGDAVVACGCALLHDPILTHGYITHMGDEIDYKLYWMGSANIIFGNSGGSVFVSREGGHAFIGIPSRIDVAGWGTPITHLSYFSPISRVYEFFDEQLYHFLIPGHSHTEEDCEAERAERQSDEQRRLLVDTPTTGSE